MFDKLSKSRGSVAFSLLPLSILCLPLTFLGLFSFLLCLEEKRFVVRGAAFTHPFARGDERRIPCCPIHWCKRSERLGKSIYPLHPWIDP